MADNDYKDADDMRSSLVLQRERRKLEQTQEKAELAEAKFREQFAKDLANAKSSVSKEIRDAVDRSERGEGWYKNRKNAEGFTGLGVRPDEV